MEFLRAAEALARQPRAIVPLQPRGARVPVFAVGGHNGDVFCYRALARHLGGDQPFFGLQPPGVDGRGAPLTRVEDLAAYFAAQIRAFRPEGPVRHRGVLRRRHDRVRAGAAAPSARRSRPVRGPLRRPLSNLVTALGQRRQHVLDMLERVRVHSRALASSSNAGRGAYLADMLRRNTARRDDNAEGVPDPVLVYREKVKDATMSGIRRYRPQYFAGRISLFLPNRRWLRSSTAVRRWKPVARDVEEYVGPDGCDGEEMLLEPHAGAIADLFRRCLEQHTR